LPMDGPAPSIVNAIADALGTPFDSIPLLPEDIFQTMESCSQSPEAPLTQGVR
jgi:CO/xanthine dehydrogenase Mo-binding subunit